ncbi:MAG: hypothetical protein WAX77_03485 [Methylococcaceae bacterium]
MKIITTYRLITGVALLLTNTAFAYSPEMKDEQCKKPKFTDFSLTEYNAKTQPEVAPESELFFKVSHWVDPNTIKVIAKGKELPLTIETTSTFHKVNLKIPAEMTGSFVRFNTTAKAVLGCDQQHGWLVKVAEK